MSFSSCLSYSLFYIGQWYQRLQDIRNFPLCALVYAYMVPCSRVGQEMDAVTPHSHLVYASFQMN